MLTCTPSAGDLPNLEIIGLDYMMKSNGEIYIDHITFLLLPLKKYTNK